VRVGGLTRTLKVSSGKRPRAVDEPEHRTWLLRILLRTGCDLRMLDEIAVGERLAIVCSAERERQAA